MLREKKQQVRICCRPGKKMCLQGHGREQLSAFNIVVVVILRDKTHFLKDKI